MPYHLSEKRSKAVELRRLHPEFTLLQIGERLGVSREWVRQLLVSEGKPTRSTSYWTRIEGRAPKVEITILECSGCQRLFVRRTMVVRRQEQDRRYSGLNTFHNNSCRLQGWATMERRPH